MFDGDVKSPEDINNPPIPEFADVVDNPHFDTDDGQLEIADAFVPPTGESARIIISETSASFLFGYGEGRIIVVDSLGNVFGGNSQSLIFGDISLTMASKINILETTVALASDVKDFGETGLGVAFVKVGTLDPSRTLPPGGPNVQIPSLTGG